ncbi:MAG TPA: PAS domain S-box protein [Leptolyngbyaceae cyanobacterium]
MKFFSKIPLKTILVVPFLLQIVTAVGLVGYLSYKNGQQAVEDLATQLMEEVGERISDRLDSYLQTPQQVVAANHLAWQNKTLDITDLARVRQHLWQQMELNPSVTGIYFLDRGGETVGYGRILSQDMQEVARKVSGEKLPIGTIYYSEAKKPAPTQRKFYTAGFQGKAQKLLYSVKMNFRTLPWYVQAKADRESAWTPLVAYQAAPALGIFAVMPVYDRVGQLQGVFASDVNLADLGTFLKKLDFSRSGQALIIDRTGNLVATSNIEKPYIEQANGRPTPLSIFKSQDIKTREIARQVQQQFSNFQNISNPQILRVISKGENLFVRVVPYQDKYGLDWLIVVAIPASDFMIRINENTRLTILLCILTLLVATEIGFLTARSIAKPISNLNKAAKKLTEGQFAEDIPLEGTKEVGELTDAFNRMARVSIDYNRTLEEQIKERTEALQRSESQINAFFSSAPVGMAIVDRQLRFVKVNQVLAQTDGFTTAEEEIGKTLREAIPKLADQLEPLYQKVLATGQPILNRELSGEVPYQEGVQHYWLVSHFPIFGGDNSPEGVGVVVVDITDRKIAEAELLESKRFIEQVTESTSAVLYIFDLIEQRNVYINSQIERLLGYSPEEIQAMGNNVFPILMHPEDIPRVIEVHAGLMLRSDREWIEVEYRMRDKEGEWHWLYSRDRVLTRTASGQPAQMLGTATEITDRKLVEAALRESEYKFSTIFQVSPDPLWIATLSEGRCLNVNNNFVKFLEYPYEEIIGKTCVDLTLWDNIEDLYRFRQILIHEDKIENFEVVVRTRTGKRKTVLMSATVSKLNDRDCVIGLLKDITDRKQIEEALAREMIRSKTLLESSVDGIVILDSRGNVLETNASFARMLGYTIEETLTLNLVDWDAGWTAEEIEHKIAENNLCVNTFETRHRRKDGSIYDVEISANQVSLDGEEVNFCICRDITDRKQTEKRLQQTLQQLSFHIENTPLSTIVWDSEFRVRHWSKQAEAIFGWTAEEVLGKTMYDWQFIFEEDLEIVKVNSRHLVKGNQTVGSNRNYRKDGKTIECEWYNSALVDESGNLVSILSLTQDVTERNRLERALQASEAKLTDIFNSVNAGIISYRLFANQDFEYEYCSKGCEIVFGYAQAELMANKGLWMSRVYPEDRNTIAQALDRILAQGGGACDYRFHHKDGSWRWLSSTYTARYDPSLNAWMTIGVSIDVSDRKRAEAIIQEREARLRLAMEVSNAIAWERNLQTDELFFTSTTAEQIAPRMPYDEALALVHPDDREKLHRANLEAITEKTGFKIEHRIAAPGQNLVWRWVQVNAIALTDAAGNCTSLIGMSVDITDRKKIEAELSQAKEAAEAANRAKSAFLANISHELRTPLNAILGFAQLIGQSPTLPAEHRDNITIINHSGKHLLTLIDDVLDMAKIEAGRVSLNEQNFNLYRLINDIERMFGLKAKEKGLQLIFQRDNAVPEYVRTDEIKLRQVLINLIGNAIKFTESGSVSVMVTLNRTNSQNLLLNWEVRDTGSGIVEDELERIFEPFLQTRTGKQSQEGTGLGLSISRKFVRLMGGEITVQSQVGVGSIFRFEIRVSLVEPFDLEIINQSNKIPLALAPNQPNYKILIADDRWDNRQLLIQLLSPLGFEIQATGDGLTALKLWETWQPHLIFIDIQMPGLSGIEVTQHIRDRERNKLPLTDENSGREGNDMAGITSPCLRGNQTKIVAVSASLLEEEKNFILGIGCDDFLHKPFLISEIFHSLHTNLGVSYLYQAVAVDSESPDMANELDFTALTADLVERLEQATIRANWEQIHRAIDEINEVNRQLAKRLKQLVLSFDYGNILKAIEFYKNLNRENKKN